MAMRLNCLTNDFKIEIEKPITLPPISLFPSCPPIPDDLYYQSTSLTKLFPHAYNLQNLFQGARHHDVYKLLKEDN